MASPFIPKSSRPTFEREVDQFLKKVTSTKFDLNERDQYNLHRLKTIANSIYAISRGEHAIVYNPLSPRYMAEVEGMGAKRSYNICEYLESLIFGGEHQKVFSDWICQLEEWLNGYEQMERGEDEFQQYMPEEWKRRDMEKNRERAELVRRCIAQLRQGLEHPEVFDEETGKPYVFYGHEPYGGITMSYQISPDYPSMPFIMRFFFDTMLNKDYFLSGERDAVIRKIADDFVVGLSRMGVPLVRIKERKSKVWPYMVFYQGLEFEPYVPLTPEALLRLCNENGFNYQKLELGEAKLSSWPDYEFNKHIEETYSHDPEVQKMKEAIRRGY